MRKTILGVAFAMLAGANCHAAGLAACDVTRPGESRAAVVAALGVPPMAEEWHIPAYEADTLWFGPDDNGHVGHWNATGAIDPLGYNKLDSWAYGGSIILFDGNDKVIVCSAN